MKQIKTPKEIVGPAGTDNLEVVTAQQQMSLLPGLPAENLKIFSLFKVPMSKFKQIPTFDARIEFLIEHMSNNIRE